MESEYTVVITLIAGIVETDADEELQPLPTEEELHSVGREITLASLPYVDGRPLRDYLSEYLVRGLTIVVSLVLPRSLLGEAVDAITFNYEEGPDTWMEGDISLDGGRELSPATTSRELSPATTSRELSPATTSRELDLSLSSISIVEGVSAPQWG
jgi:hypothetical protein